MSINPKGLEGLMYDGSQQLPEYTGDRNILVYGDNFEINMLLDKKEHTIYKATTEISCITVMDGDLVLMFEDAAIRLCDRIPVPLPAAKKHVAGKNKEYCCSSHEIYAKMPGKYYSFAAEITHGTITCMALYTNGQGDETPVVGLKEGYLIDALGLHPLSEPVFMSNKSPITSVAFFEGELFKIQHNRLYTAGNHLVNVNCNRIKDSLNQLAVHNGRLIAGDGDGAIIDIQENSVIFKTKKKITDLTSIPRETAIKVLNYLERENEAT